jgi:hypothetical protein
MARGLHHQIGYFLQKCNLHIYTNIICTNNQTRVLPNSSQQYLSQF